MAEQAEDPTLPLTAAVGPAAASPLHVPPSTDASTIRLFNSPAFFRLWTAQVVSSLGDWLGRGDRGAAARPPVEGMRLALAALPDDTGPADILATLTDIVQARTFEELERYGFDDPPA